MSVKVFDTKEVQDLLKAAANVGSQDGNARAKQIVNRLLSDLFKAIDDLDITLFQQFAVIRKDRLDVMTLGEPNGFVV